MGTLPVLRNTWDSTTDTCELPAEKVCHFRTTFVHEVYFRSITVPVRDEVQVVNSGGCGAELRGCAPKCAFKPMDVFMHLLRA